jgi:hypothetical protein
MANVARPETAAYDDTPPLTAPKPNPATDACYLAMQAHDARFDGRFFTAVTSTGIYCRPVCRVKHAAARELPLLPPCRAGRGSRLPALPALPPRTGAARRELVDQDASDILALQAARLLDEPDAWSDEGPGAAQIAAAPGHERPPPAPHLRGAASASRRCSTCRRAACSRPSNCWPTPTCR